MKKTLYLILFMLSLQASAQIVPSSGPYTTSDGYYTVNISFKSGLLTVVEPNKTSPYTLVSGNEYRFVNPTNGIDYRIEVVNATTLACFKPTNLQNRTMLLFSGSLNEAATAKTFTDYSKVAEKYKNLMKTDAKDAQLWSFCAAAANARSSMNEDGFANYAAKIIASMKQIIVKPTKCPCEDAIPAVLWN
jgi:hypothetical protein